MISGYSKLLSSFWICSYWVEKNYDLSPRNVLRLFHKYCMIFKPFDRFIQSVDRNEITKIQSSFTKLKRFEKFKVRINFMKTNFFLNNYKNELSLLLKKCV